MACPYATTCRLFNFDVQRAIWTLLFHGHHRDQSDFIGVKRPDNISVIRRVPMLKSVSICTALILAAAVFADSAEARQGFGGGGRSMGGFSGARMAGWSGARVGGWSSARLGGWRGARAMTVAGPNRFAGPGRVAWSGRGNWSGGRWAGNWSGSRWAGNWRGGHFRRGGFWPWWGVGAGVALAAATWPYPGYGDSCVQWVPDYGWVNVCGYPYGGYGYGGYGYW
jgi:hypothetical protein